MTATAPEAPSTQVRRTRTNPLARIGVTRNHLDERFFTAEPTDGLELMNLEFRKRWTGELESLLAACESSLHVDLRGACAALRGLGPDERWSPAAYAAIAGLRIALLKRNVTDVMDAIAVAQQCSHASLTDARCRTESILTETWERDFVAHMRAYEPLGKNGEKTLVLPILTMNLAPVAKSLDVACDAIRLADPVIDAERVELVTRIKLFQGRVLRGETNTRVYGAVFFRLAPPAWNQLVYWVEHLVHEISHLRLELLRVHDPIVENDLEPKYAAPFRRDPRPMLGVFHATFVLSRMLRVVRRLAAAGVDPMFEQRIPVLQEKFEIGLREIATHASLTPLGRRIFESMEGTSRG